MKRSFVLYSLFIILALLFTACAPAATTEAPAAGDEVEVQPSPMVETQVVTQVVRETELVEVTAEPGERVVVEFWSTDNEEERVNRYEEVAQRFMDANPNVEVRIVPIEEAGIAQRIATARGANRLPAIVRMGVERTQQFAAEGLLDQEAATAVIQSIGEDQFREGPLGMVQSLSGDGYLAVPFDGWLQAFWYRSDVFDELGLEAPTTWETVNAACDQLAGTNDLLYAMTIGTDPGQNYPHQMFEQVAISNDAWPFDAEGNVSFDTENMIEALRFYTELQRCAPPGPQYWQGARETYELGQSGMMVYSTYIMDDLVEGSGTAEGGMIEIAVEDLAANTGFAPTLQGPNGEATYGQLVALGIMEGAPAEAQDVVEFFLTEGYLDILELAPFGKVPVTVSAAEGWKTSSPYFENYSDETLDQILNGYDSMERWLFNPNYDENQRAVVGEIESRLLVSQALSYIALEGTMTPETAAQWLQEQVEQVYAQYQE
jgi:multiple sugar transport system substrate-binding protein